MSEPIIVPELVLLDADAGGDAAAVIKRLAQLLAEAGRCSDPGELAEAALEREAKSPTGLPGGLAIPHARVDSVSTASLAMARLSHKVDFGGPDGPADIVFLIAAPAGAGSEHMKLLSSLARALVRPDFVAELRQAPDTEAIVTLVGEAVAPKPAAAKPAAESSATRPASAQTSAAAQTSASAQTPAGATAPAAGSSGAAADPESAGELILAITACPTGIAHTYMAADALKLAAERAGVEYLVETQGSSGTTPFTADQIKRAGAVIFATDVGVKGRERFAGKPVIESGVKRAINEPDAMLAEARAAATDPHARRVAAGDGGSSAEETGAGVGFGGRLKQALLTGVSYMIPFVAAGGLLMALGFLFGGYEIANAKVCVPSGLDEGTVLYPAAGCMDGMNDAAFYALNNSLWNLPPGGVMQYLGAVFFAIGSLAMAFMVPVLAGYIAYAIADRPGIAPGFTAGAVALAVSSGFIGGLIGGLFAGVVALWLTRLNLPRWAAGLMPVVIIPLCASLVVGVIMYMFLGRPLGWVNEQMTDGLNSMSGGSKIALGVVLGLMMCFDLGGPVNKAAYAFGVAGLGLTSAGVAQWQIMAAVMAAGMVPPLALALASTVLRPGRFTDPERENGKAAWLLGASFISEGAIPFAAADPLRVIPPMMIGGAVTGGLVMALDVQLRAPHGGVFVLFAMNGTWWKFLIALAVGTVVAAVGVIVAKAIGTTSEEAAAQTVAAQ
ncbi:putative phosphotransferase system enzyme II [Gordonia hirsuta DSM 44140 = NBRC 16056]|uniref:Putative phosphotransferase system enzyme II n=1 Tax=Gordonia hirsuta DSM 44140 = NBRC 16056 TaxID=1121927 RepID=L7LBK3_9ACTN|nr:fructose-specific PTS transporter subunit EIIC [Gordonia hirsuta]GAC58314.1 putative phosphotransferase system enzyme II [Gordonia hirsuta DSM 44140 = NBRC 16056]